MKDAYTDNSARLGLISFLLGAIAAFTGAAGAQVSPVSPLDEILNDARRALVVEAVIGLDDVVTTGEVYVSSAPPAGNAAGPPHLLVRYFDRDANELGQHLSWDPRSEVWESETGEHADTIVEGEIGAFMAPFRHDLASISISALEVGEDEVALEKQIAVVVVMAQVEEFCVANPGDPNCDGFLPTDTDGDGVADVADNCPSSVNADQADDDLDGIGDVCDPDFETDSDGDSVPDGLDACPSENATGFDVDGNGCLDSLHGLIGLLGSLLDEGVIDATMRNSLLAKVENAEKSATKENVCAAINLLEALKNQVLAQVGKKISVEAGGVVIAYIDSIIAYQQSLIADGGSCS